jgi:hypothetical protein
MLLTHSFRLEKQSVPRGELNQLGLLDWWEQKEWLLYFQAPVCLVEVMKKMFVPLSLLVLEFEEATI